MKIVNKRNLLEREWGVKMLINFKGIEDREVSGMERPVQFPSECIYRNMGKSYQAESI